MGRKKGSKNKPKITEKVLDEILEESKKSEKEILYDLNTAIEQEIKKKITAIKAIRLKCLDCSGGSKLAVKECPCNDCPIYPFRMGKNPNCTGKRGNPNIGKLRKKNV